MKLSDGRLEYERSFHDDDYGRRKERERVRRYTEGIDEYAYRYFWQEIHGYLGKLQMKNARFLDYGCGEGSVALRLWESGARLVDLEYFQKYFKLEKKHFVLSILPFLPFRPLLGKNFRRLVQRSWNIDDALFRLCPFLKKYSWIVVLTFLKE